MAVTLYRDGRGLRISPDIVLALQHLLPTAGVAGLVGGIDAAIPFALGGLAGVMYQYLLQVRHLEASWGLPA